MSPAARAKFLNLILEVAAAYAATEDSGTLEYEFTQYNRQTARLEAHINGIIAAKEAEIARLNEQIAMMDKESVK